MFQEGNSGGGAVERRCFVCGICRSSFHGYFWRGRFGSVGSGGGVGYWCYFLGLGGGVEEGGTFFVGEIWGGNWEGGKSSSRHFFYRCDLG